MKTKLKRSITIKTRSKRARPRKSGAGSPMQTALANHLKMVVDPCNAPLTETIYPNSTGVLRNRVRKIYNSSHTPATTAGTYSRVIAWHPIHGAFVLGGGSANVYPMADFSTTFSRIAALSRYGSPSGSSTFSARAVSGCLSMAWSSFELQREGMIFSGVVPGGMIFNYLNTADGGVGTAVSANTLAGMLSVSCRTPNDKCEVTWVPTEWDANWTDPAMAGEAGYRPQLQEQFNKVNFVLMLWIGSQIVGDTASFCESAVSVIEENPQTELYVQDAAHVSTTGLPGGVTKIVSTLQKRDTSWYVNTFKKLGQLGLAAMSAYARGGALGLVSEVAGLSLAPRKNVAA